MSPLELGLIGGLYALVFWALAFRHPRWPLLLIVALAPFQTDISGGGPFRFSIAEVNLFLALPVVLIRSRRLIFGPTLWPALLYLAVCVFSAIGQWRGPSTVSFMQTALYTIVLVTVFASFPRRLEDYRPAFNGLIVIAFFLAVLISASGSAYVLGLHKNGVGGSLAIAFVVAFELWLAARGRARWFYLIAWAGLAFGCLLSLSRGAWMTAIMGVMVLLGMRGRLTLLVKCLVLIVPLLALAWKLVPAEQRSYAFGFNKERSNIKARYESLDYALNCFYANPIQGAGLGLRKEYDATNVVFMALGETGVLGLSAFLLLHGVIVVSVWRLYRRLPRNTFAASILALALALTLGKFMHGLVDHYWSRGSLTVVWASLGMAARVAFEEKKRRRHERRMALQSKQPSGSPAALVLAPSFGRAQLS